MSESYDLADYVDVAERCRKFFADYPEGSLRPANPDQPFEFVYLDEERAGAYQAAYKGKGWARYQPTCFVVYTAAAYRSPDDPNPGIGVAWEPFPGLTSYTHNSEVMNAETSAWGRAIVAVGAAEAKASADEVRNRRAEQADGPDPRAAALDRLREKLDTLDTIAPDDMKLWADWKADHQSPLWSNDVALIREADTFVAGLLASHELELFDDGPAPVVGAPGGGPALSPPPGDDLYLHADGTSKPWPNGRPTGRWKSEELAIYLDTYGAEVPDGKAQRLADAVALYDDQNV